MEKLELIDFPGLDIKDDFSENIFSSLMRFTDGFIFVNNCIQLILNILKYQSKTLFLPIY